MFWKLKGFFSFFVLFLLFSISMFAEGQNYKIERFFQEKNIFQKSVFSLLQDSRGFMWFGTEAGLIRYDGYNFKYYLNAVNAKGTISSNYINSIFEDKNGNLWIGTDNGLNFYDKQKDEFKVYKSNEKDENTISGDNIKAIVEDNEGFLWVGTDTGLNKFDLKSEKVKRYKTSINNDTSISGDTITSMVKDQDGLIWVGTENGLNSIDTKNDKIVRYVNDITVKESLSNDSIFALAVDKNNHLWIGTDDGINVFDKVTGKFKVYLNNPQDSLSLVSNNIRTLSVMRNGNIAIGTKMGMNILELDKDKFTVYKSEPFLKNTLGNNIISAIYEDRSGVLWVGNARGGLNKFTPEKFKIIKNEPENINNNIGSDNISAFAEDSEGNFLIGTDEGLVVQNIITKKYEHIRNSENDPNSLSDNKITSLLKDRDGEIWIGTESGLDKMTKNNKISHIKIMNGNIKVRMIFEESDGTIWIGTNMKGLVKFNKKSMKSVVYINNPSDPQSISSNNITMIGEDRDKNIWVGTDEGLSKMDKSTEKFTSYKRIPKDTSTIRNNLVTTMSDVGDGKIYFGTNGGGICVFNKSGTFEDNGNEVQQTGKSIFAMVTDKEILWLATEYGIVKYDTKSRSISAFGSDFDVEIKEFNIRSSYKSFSNEIFFGSGEGIVAFYPAQAKKSTYVPKIVITDFKVQNKSRNTGEPLYMLNNVELSYKDSFFSFEFAALDYNAPERIKYAYMLEGFDEEWVNIDNKRYASYTNLEGGSYIFKVKATNSDGVMSSLGYDILVVITPPWWKTWWAKLLIILIVMLLLSVYIRLKLLQSDKKRLIQAEKIKELSAEMNKTLKLHEVMGMLLKNIAHLVQYDSAKVIIDGVAAIEYKDGKDVELDFVKEKNIFDFISKESKPIIIKNTVVNSEMAGLNDKNKSLLGLPIISNGKNVGVVALYGGRADTFTKEHQTLAEIFISQASMSIENAKLFEKINIYATVDDLTSVYNRRYFNEIAEEAFIKAKESNGALTMMLASVDFKPNFKEFNEIYGRKAGDNVLKNIADKFMEIVGKEGVVGRYAGGEFVVMLEGKNEKESKVIAAKIEKEIAELKISLNENKKSGFKVNVIFGIVELSKGIKNYMSMCEDLEIELASAVHRINANRELM